MAIIEVLRGRFIAGNLGAAGAVTNYGSFVADNTVADVVTDTAAVAFPFTFTTVTGRYKFVEADNIEILSVWCCLPYHYVFSQPGASIFLVRGNNASVGPILQVAPPDGRVTIPVANSEIAIGAYVPWGGVAAGSYMSLGGNLVDSRVSQIGGAAILNGARFYSTLCIKVLHNLPITA